VPQPSAPSVTEVKWRKSTLKLNSVGATDAGKIDIITPVILQEVLLAQQRVPQALTGEKLLFLIHRITSYALPGVANAGGEVYPSTKIRIHPTDNQQQLATSWAQDEREDCGDLNGPARLSYVWPKWQQQRVLLADATTAICVIENYHCARGYIYVELSYAYAEE